MDRTLWSIQSSRSAVFLKTHVSENRRKRTITKLPSVFSKVFAEQQGEEERWKEDDSYTASNAILARGHKLHSLDTYQN